MPPVARTHAHRHAGQAVKPEALRRACACPARPAGWNFRQCRPRCTHALSITDKTLINRSNAVQREACATASIEGFRETNLTENTHSQIRGKEGHHSLVGDLQQTKSCLCHCKKFRVQQQQWVKCVRNIECRVHPLGTGPSRTRFSRRDACGLVLRPSSLHDRPATGDRTVSPGPCHQTRSGCMSRDACPGRVPAPCPAPRRGGVWRSGARRGSAPHRTFHIA